MATFMSKASELCDDPSGINNYAEPSLQLASTFRNRSKQFKSKLTLQHPIVQKFSSQQQQQPATSKSNEEKEIKIFSEFLKSTSVGRKRNFSPNENRPINVTPKQQPPKPSLASWTETPRFGPSFEPQKPKFGNQKGFGFGEPARPSFQSSVARNSNVPNSNSVPKFGLPGVGPRPPAVQRFPPIQRQGSFGRNNDFSSNGK